MNIMDSHDQLPVSVIASFSPEGEMIPIYFSFQGNKLKIDNIRWNSIGKWGCKYRCEVMDENTVKTIDLVYYNENRKWKLKI